MSSEIELSSPAINPRLLTPTRRARLSPTDTAAFSCPTMCGNRVAVREYPGTITQKVRTSRWAAAEPSTVTDSINAPIE